jgi:hypothetical protein
VVRQRLTADGVFPDCGRRVDVGCSDLCWLRFDANEVLFTPPPQRNGTRNEPPGKQQHKEDEDDSKNERSLAGKDATSSPKIERHRLNDEGARERSE